jgi:hypothetical protein
MDPLLLLRELSQMGDLLETKADLSRLPAISELDPESCYLGWSVRLTAAQTPEQISEVFAFVQDSSQVSIEVELDNQAWTTDQRGTREAEVNTLPECPSFTVHVPLAKAAELIHIATDLVYAQTHLLRTANILAAIDGRCPSDTSNPQNAPGLPSGCATRAARMSIDAIGGCSQKLT